MESTVTPGDTLHWPGVGDVLPSRTPFSPYILKCSVGRSASILSRKTDSAMEVTAGAAGGVLGVIKSIITVSTGTSGGPALSNGVTSCVSLSTTLFSNPVQSSSTDNGAGMTMFLPQRPCSLPSVRVVGSVISGAPVSRICINWV